jgi:hypothetical protein
MRTFIFIAFPIIFALLGSSQGVMTTQAQSNTWSEPVNLSQSGSTSSPVLVVDSEGTFHAVWSDEFAGNKYASGNGVDWSQPVVVDLPFTDSVPELLADKEGYIHAFWLESTESTNIEENTSPLLYSTVRATDFASSSAWTSPVQLAEAALDFDIALDQNDDLHLIYIRPIDSTEFPAGAYYRKLVTGDTEWTWSSPALIYSSPYFRSIKMEDSSVDIATSTIDGSVQVYAVWDNRPRERVYLAISTDGGQTWGSPDEIDKPDNGLGYNSTGKILVEAHDQDVLLVWQRSSSGGACSQYYQKSMNGGDTWSQPKEVGNSSINCSQENQLISDGNGLIYLWVVEPSQVTLLAWDKQQWSNPQVQSGLSAFTDPETQKLVIFDCRQPVLNGNQRLAVLGCDSSGGGDIWFTERNLNDVDSWFSQQSAWSEVEELTSSQTKIDTPVLLAAPDNQLLALWSQADQDFGRGEKAAIYLARWDGKNWIEARPIIRTPEGSLTQPAAVIDDKGIIFAVWSASGDGKLYFSWVDSANAQEATEWSEPITLPISQPLAFSPKIHLDKSGNTKISR